MTISDVLTALNLVYGHIVVRKKLDVGFEVMGGGTVDSVCSRFGDYVVKYSNIIDNVLILYI